MLTWSLLSLLLPISGLRVSGEVAGLTAGEFTASWLPTALKALILGPSSGGLDWGGAGKRARLEGSFGRKADLG